MPHPGIRRLPLLIGACLGLAIIIFIVVRTRQWEETISQGHRAWRNGNVTHVDENGDGIVDEEVAVDSKTGKRTFRRDTDRDGYFDLKYNLSESGVATNITRIRDRAPRHQGR